MALKYEILNLDKYPLSIQHKTNKISNVSSKTVDALKQYFLDSRSLDICKKLRENSPLTPNEKKIADELDFLFDLNSQTAGSSFTVYRGVRCLPDDLLNASENSIIDKGFVSVSKDKNIADAYRSGGTLLEIEIPKGQKYLDYANFKKFDDSFVQNGNRELLLPRNSVFEVVSCDKKNNIVHLRYMGQKTPLPKLQTEGEYPAFSSYPADYYLELKYKTKKDFDPYF